MIRGGVAMFVAENPRVEAQNGDDGCAAQRR